VLRRFLPVSAVAFPIAPIFLTLLLPAAASAEQPVRAIGLREAVVIAARNNPTLAEAVDDVTIAGANVTAAAGIDDFVLDAGATWTRTRLELVPGSPLQQTKGDDVLVSTSLTRHLSTGGTVGLRLSTDLSRSEYASDLGSGPVVSTVNAANPSLQLTATQPLLRGAGARVARADQRRARAARDIAGLERDATAALLVRNVVAAYWDTALAAEEVAIRRTLSESARQQLLAVQAAIGVEKQAPSASAEVRVAVALREDDAIAADEALRAQSVSLTRLLGLEVDPRAALWTATDRPEAVPVDVSVTDALAAAMEHNPQLAAVRARGRAAAIEVEVGWNGMLPELDVVASGGPTGSATDAGTALGQLAGFRSYNVQVGLSLQEPIGRHAARGALAAAQTALHKARLTETDITAQIRAAVLRQVGLIDAARRRIAALGDAAESADLDLASVRARFEVGRASNFEVLWRQDQVAQARLHLLRARVDYLEARADLDVLTGDILPLYGISAR
jgi:outer membrane protein TolC